MAKTRREKRKRRRMHIRKTVYGTKDIPRVSVFRSSRYIFVQLVDDDERKCICGLWERGLKQIKDEKPVDKAARMGIGFGKTVAKKGYKKIVFDRGGYKFHGRIKAFADGMRKSGIKF